MNIINLKSKDVFMGLTLLLLAWIMTFGIFFPVDGKIISDDFKYNNNSYSVTTNPILYELKSNQKPRKIGEEFTFSSDWPDQLSYMRMANHEEVGAPYQFRILYPWLIGIAMDFERLVSDKIKQLNKYRLAQLNFWVFNYIFLILSIFIFFKILQNFTGDTSTIFIALVAFTSQYSILNTASFPMLDIFSYFIFLATFYFLIKKKFILTGILLVCSVLTKDSSIIWAPALMAMALESKDKRYFYLSLIPFVPFALVRLYYGYGALNVQYDWDIAHGEIKFNYLSMHLTTMRGLIAQLLGMTLAYGISWLYIGKINVLKEYNLKYFFITFLLLLLIAELMLSSSITRVLAPIFPVFMLIPVIYISKYSNEK